jgi:membrane protein YdbS with pleckstrin-like domain
VKFIKKKNLLEGEDLLYVPILHWMYVIKPAVLFLLLIPVLLVIEWAIIGYSLTSIIVQQFVVDYYIYLIWIIAAIAAIILVIRIFMYMGIEYGITNKRLLIKRGSIKIRTAEIPMDRIKSIFCQQSLLGRIFNYGNVSISGTGTKMLVLFMIFRPYTVRKKIVSIMEKNKLITVTHGELPKPKPITKPMIEEEPPYRYGTFVKVLP